MKKLTVIILFISFSYVVFPLLLTWYFIRFIAKAVIILGCFLMMGSQKAKCEWVKYVDKIKKSWITN